MLAINITTLALLIRSVGATFAHTLVDADSEPNQGLVDIVFGSGHKALRVGIFDTGIILPPC